MFYIIIGLLLPFFGTALGSLLVFFYKSNFKDSFYKKLLSLSGGIMFSASIWSLILKAIEINNTKFSIIYVSAGFICGVLLLFLIDNIKKTSFNNMIFAVTLHNIPEGMAVGVCFAGLLSRNIDITLISCFMLSFGIAIQNFPEGSIISMPLNSNGLNKTKSFIYGVLSGIVEPVFGFITLLFTDVVVSLLPFLLSFAAGAMIYVVIVEIIPESYTYKYYSFYFSFGFLLMMILDVCFG